MIKKETIIYLNIMQEQMKIIRVLPGVYNEIDILEENLKFYIDQGFETVVVDNGSTDGSYELCKKYLGKGIVKLSQIKTKEFDTRLLLKEATLLIKMKIQIG